MLISPYKDLHYQYHWYTEKQDWPVQILDLALLCTDINIVMIHCIELHAHVIMYNNVKGILYLY